MSRRLVQHGAHHLDAVEEDCRVENDAHEIRERKRLRGGLARGLSPRDLFGVDSDGDTRPRHPPWIDTFSLEPHRAHDVADGPLEGADGREPGSVGPADSGKAEYRGSNASGFATVGALERTIGDVVSAVRLEREGVDPRVVARARIPVRIDTKKIAGGKTTGETAAQSFSLAYFMGIILYTAILLYGINVMSSVLEEKTTRIVGVLVSSLRPFQLMLGKVLGVGAV